MRVFCTIVLVALFFCTQFACNPNGNNKESEKFVIDAKHLKFAEQLYQQANNNYTKGMYLPAAENLHTALFYLKDIEPAKEHRNLTEVKANVHYLYGLTLIDIYNNADKRSLEIRDETGKVIGMKASPELALHHVNIAIELNSQEALYYKGKGYIYLMNGEVKESLKWFNTAIGRDRRDPMFFALRGLAFYEMAKACASLEDRKPYMRKSLDDATMAKTISIARGLRCKLAYEVFLRLYLLQGDRKSAEAVIKDMQQRGYDIQLASDLFYGTK